MLGYLMKGLVRDQLRLATSRWSWRRRHAWSSPPRVSFVAATRLPEHEFWTNSALGVSLQRFRNDARVDMQLSFENTRGLPEVYNRAIESNTKADIVVFLHDDIWLTDELLLQKLEAALARFDIVGVAGNIRRLAAQPAWLYSSIGSSGFVWDHGYLSGSILHGSPERPERTCFGAAPASCELLDGVFLACRRQELVKRGVRFDDRFMFHFYDLDLCRSARQSGLKLGTWPVEMIHQSAGIFGSEEWVRAYQVYLDKWGQ